MKMDMLGDSKLAATSDDGNDPRKRVQLSPSMVWVPSALIANMKTTDPPISAAPRGGAEGQKMNPNRPPGDQAT